MRCPECRDVVSSVLDSRPTDDYGRIRRRRECLKGHRFTTYEVDADDLKDAEHGKKRAQAIIKAAHEALGMGGKA